MNLCSWEFSFTLVPVCTDITLISPFTDRLMPYWSCVKLLLMQTQHFLLLLQDAFIAKTLKELKYVSPS